MDEPAEFAIMEKRLQATPGTPEFMVDFWRQELKKLDQRLQ